MVVCWGTAWGREKQGMGKQIICACDIIFIKHGGWSEIVFVKDSVKCGLREINHERLRSSFAGGARGFAKLLILHHEGAHTQIKS